MSRRLLGSRILLGLILVGLASSIYAATDTVLLLYTADIHDHIRSGSSGRGGLPYVSGYVKQVRAERSDVVLVDAGDLLNKGHWLSFATKGLAMYEAMDRIGYAAGAPGNHDFLYGFEQLLKNTSVSTFPLLCANLPEGDGTALLPSSVVVDADGVKVGIIGFTLPAIRCGSGGVKARNHNDTGAVLAQLATELDVQAQLIVAVGHFPSRKCAQLAKLAPSVDVFVAGHSHEALREPLRVPETGALVVQGGSNANFVGRLELSVDMDTEEIVEHTVRLVGLEHGTTPVDSEMALWIEQQEEVTCPQAREVLGKAGQGIAGPELAKLYARAVREAAGTELALVNPRMLLGGFVAGQVIDYNAVFASHRLNGRGVVTARLSGAAVLRFLGTFKQSAACPCWDGFTAEMTFGKPAGQRVGATDLDVEREYSVAMNAHLLEQLNAQTKSSATADSVTTCSFSTVEALRSYIRKLNAQGDEVRRIVR